ncbi:MAG: PD-(D/E)XK nuclease family protein, partial [bacterium]|nr:PD-(D/E)XK nuclease family protein [bacterium]
MAKDTYSAVWVSHSSISDFLKCPRSYYLKNVYKDPQTGHKIAITSPPLALGQAVHEVIESLSILPTQDRFKESLMVKYEKSWNKISGKRGGFSSEEQETLYRQRGEAMLRRVMENPGPVARRAVKIKMELPHYWLSEDDGIILCGK